MSELEEVLEKIKKPKTMESIIEIANRVGDYSEEDVKNLVKKLVNNYIFYKTPNNKYVPIKRTSFRIGRYRHFRNGSGEVISNEQKYYISEDNNSSAINGDLVLIDTYIPAGSRDKSCRIKEILERDLSTIVGEIVKIDNSFYVVPEENDKKSLTILLEGNNYIIGEKVVVDCSDKRNDNFYVGKITNTIGHKDDPGVDIIMEAYKYDINPEFPKEVIDEVNSMPQVVLPQEMINRTDLRKEEIFTIDGDDTKDIDDAISLKILDNGNYLLGVHIADVTHYVTLDTLTYKEARKRATSSYLADKVIPMLPHKLSNGICSLNPDVDRLAVSCIMEIDNNGNVVNHKICKSVIKSNMQMTYNKVNNILENNIVDEKYSFHVDTLKNMFELSKILHNKRMKRGAVELNKPELKLIVEDSKVVDFSKRYQRSAEKLIEEFMLIANETVAEHMSRYPFIYRVHDYFDESKMQSFISMLNMLGYNFNVDIYTNNLGSRLAKMLNNEEDTLSEMLKVQLLRTFKKAFYSDENIGHYGLASDSYCHFTSPIRRFPDTTVHELIKEFEFSDEDKNKLREKWENELPKIAENSSIRERKSDECERMVLLMKCAEYMENHIGERFIGTITSMDSDGMYIELDNMIEGKVRLKDLDGNYYYSEENLSFISLDNNEDYYLGDILDLIVSYASKEKKVINFKIVSKKIENNHINKVNNNKVKKLKKQEKLKEMYYNVNKGKKR